MTSTEAPTNAVPLRLFFKKDDPGFSVLEARGRFAMSEIWEVELLAQLADPSFAPSEVKGRGARLALLEEPGAPVLCGVIAAIAEVSGEATGVTRYRIRMCSRYWWMTKYRDNRIWKHTRVDELVSEYLQEHELPSADVAFVGEHTERAYRVQYAETDAELVFRALAEDGVASYFDFSTEDSTLVLTDDTRTHRADRVVVLPFVSPGSLTPPAWHAHSFALEATQEHEGVELRDYWERSPRFEAKAEHCIEDEDDAMAVARVDFVPGVAADEAALRRSARDLLDAEDAPSRVARIKTTAFVWPGQRLVLEGGHREEAASVRTVISTTSRWTTAIVAGSTVPRCEHEVVALNAKRRFLPRRPPKSRIHGIQTARVTGDGEIDVDAEGRVHVTFPWDPETQSVRVRVAQAWAGPQYGLVCIPRVGDEVLVSYLDGDPEQPIIVGRVFNGLNQAPLTLPEEKTVSVWRTRSSPAGEGYNEIRLDDRAGEERFDVHAQRDASLKVERDAEMWVGRNSSVTVIGDQKTWIDGSGDVGFREVLNLSGEKTTLEGRTELTIKGPKTMMIAGERGDVVSGTLSVITGSELHRARKAFRVDAEHIGLHAKASIRISCGGSSIVLKPGGITIESSGPVVMKGAPIKLNC